MLKKLTLLLAAIHCSIDQNLADGDLFSKFLQNDYNVKNDRMMFGGYNNKYLQDLQMIQFKYNRSTSAVNYTILPKVDFTKENVLGICQFQKRYGNEFKYFPVRFAMPACQALERNILGLATFTCGKLLCPMKKNVRQTACNWRPDFSRMPPFLPDGEYVGRVNVTYNDQYLFNYDYFFTVYRKVKIPT